MYLVRGSLIIINIRKNMHEKTLVITYMEDLSATAKYEINWPLNVTTIVVMSTFAIEESVEYCKMRNDKMPLCLLPLIGFARYTQPP